MDKVYQALYNPMTEESAWTTLSIHRTKEGAQAAVDRHRAAEKEKWDNLYRVFGFDEPHAFDKYQKWSVIAFRILD